jgi:hypothetical protein
MVIPLGLNISSFFLSIKKIWLRVQWIVEER